MPDELKPEPGADFVAAFRDGEAMAREWISDRGELPELLLIVRAMPRGGDMGGLEAGFLSTVDAAVRGDRRGQAVAPDPAKAQLLLERAPGPEGSQPPLVDVDEFRRRRREREMAARLQELGRRNAEAWGDQGRAFGGGDYRQRDAEWGGV